MTTELAPHQQRVVDEKAELDGRISRLAAFFNNPAFGELPRTEQNRMRRQHLAQRALSSILGERIDAFSGRLAPSEAREADIVVENAVLREYFLASQSLQTTLGHEEASAEDERRAEARYEAALQAARKVVLYADGKLLSGPEMFQREAHDLALRAKVWGVIVTVEQRSPAPLAMGHLETVVTARSDRTGNHAVAAA